jgi:hypothetical protein
MVRQRVAAPKWGVDAGETCLELVVHGQVKMVLHVLVGMHLMLFKCISSTSVIYLWLQGCAWVEMHACAWQLYMVALLFAIEHQSLTGVKTLKSGIMYKHMYSFEAGCSWSPSLSV